MHGLVLAIPALIGASACGSAGGEPYRAVPGGNPGRGAVALKTYGCGACHVIPGIGGADGMVGPPLTAFGRRTIIAGELTNSEDNLIRWIQHPQGVIPGNVMPDLGVTAQDARDIAAYLYTLK